MSRSAQRSAASISLGERVDIVDELWGSCSLAQSLFEHRRLISQYYRLRKSLGYNRRRTFDISTCFRVTRDLLASGQTFIWTPNLASLPLSAEPHHHAGIFHVRIRNWHPLL